jgi:hypothetical protein
MSGWQHCALDSNGAASLVFLLPEGSLSFLSLAFRFVLLVFVQ